MHRAKLPAICVLVLLVLASAAFAQPRNRWVPFGPGGGLPRGLAVDSRNPAVVYAVSGALYRSADGGETWTGLFGRHLQVVALDPAHPAAIYVGGDQLARSTDGGRTWQTTSPPGILFDVTSLAVIPGSPSILLAGSDSRLLRSADGGSTWSTAFIEGPVTSILVDPGSPGTAYYTDGSGLLKSTDAGESWFPAGPSASGQPIPYGHLSLARGALYLRAGSAIFRSADGARSWRQTGAPPAGRSLERVFLADPASPSRLYLAGLDGVFVSTDDGATWRRLARGLPPLPSGEVLAIYSLAADPSRPGALYAGTSEWGVARSANGGERWRIGVEPGLSDGTVALFEIHPRRPDTFYIGLATHGERSFRSIDGGRTWQPFARAIARDGLLDLAFDPADPDRLYAVDDDGLWRSRDGGETWDQIDRSTYRVAVSTPGTLLAGRDCGLSRSTNDGRTWTRVIPCYLPGNADDIVGVVELWADPRNPRNLYALMQATNGLSFLVGSADGGATWKRLKTGPSLAAVAPGDFRTLYIVVNQQILRSRDGGESWQVVHAQPPSPDSYGALAVDATHPDTIYVATFQHGVLRSRDGGATLQAIGGPFEGSKPGASLLVTARNHPGTLWAAAFDGGLFSGHFE